MDGDVGIEQLATTRAGMALRADGSARSGRGEIREPEGACDDDIAHDVVLGVGRTRAVARLATDLDRDCRSRRSVTCCVTGQAT